MTILGAMRRYIQAGEFDEAFECLRHDYAEKKDHRHVAELRRAATDAARKGDAKAFNVVKRTYWLTAKDNFDDYCIYLEWNREPSKKFYLPRRKQLLPLVESLQDMADDKIDLLAISLPPGVGKTTLAIFYLSWIGGRNPELSNLGGSHSNSFLRGVYEELLRITGEGEYLWRDVFPMKPVTNAKDLRIDFGEQKRFQTFQFSSLGSENAGKVRASGLLYCDDLVEGIETALSKDRLDKLWQQYTVDFRQRKIGNAKELHIATRWSVYDVIGRLEEMYGEDERCRFIAVPALNDLDKSNFDYPYGVGFSTEFYHQQREIMDDVSWRCLYMNEPVEREGLLFNPDELRRYFELPEQVDGIFAVCDTKDRGIDYCVMPIAYQCGNDFYIDKIVCNNGAPDAVEGEVIAALLERNVQMARFESNSSGGMFAKNVQQKLRERGGITKITTKYSTENKETRIIMDSPFVKERFLFKDESKYDKEYRQAMNMLCSWTMAGKNKHDDVPDAMSMLSNYIQNFGGNKVQLFDRFW